MSFLDLASEVLNITETEKGDKAYKTSNNSCLDYFYMVGGKRNDVEGVLSLFIRAFLDEPKTALKLLLFTRDIKGGLGERKLFRYLLVMLAKYESETAKLLIPSIVKYGRYDDLLCLIGTPLEDDVIALIKKQLVEDLKNKKEGKSISLLAKWLPSINTSKDEARATALYLAEKLGLSKADYRKALSFLRKGLIIENNLREKDYSFNYESVPSSAMNNYRKAFERNDKKRFKDYIKKVEKGEAEMNIGVLDIVTFIKRAQEAMSKSEEADYYEATWKKLVEESVINSKTLVVRDGSGSMYSYWPNPNIMPIHIANALTLLTAARLTGEFKDKFITFSNDSEIVDMSNKKTLFQKLLYLESFDDCGTTNVQSVYHMIIDVYKHPNFKKEDAIEQIMFVSDMEFDQLRDRSGKPSKLSNLEYFKNEFAKFGYKMPTVIFWNVASRGKKVPVTSNEYGVKLISGGSKNIIDMVINTKSIDPLDFMYKALEPYAFIDELIK